MVLDLIRTQLQRVLLYFHQLTECLHVVFLRLVTLGEGRAEGTFISRESVVGLFLVDGDLSARSESLVGLGTATRTGGDDGRREAIFCHASFLAGRTCGHSHGSRLK